jgi:hypothetical protein
MRQHHRRVDISVEMSGPHDFAVRLGCARLAPPKRPPHPAPNVRDDRETPLMWGGTGELLKVICPTAKAKYFLRRGWTEGPNQLEAQKGGAFEALSEVLG